MVSNNGHRLVMLIRIWHYFDRPFKTRFSPGYRGWIGVRVVFHFNINRAETGFQAASTDKTAGAKPGG